MLKLTRNNTPIKARIQNYKEETNPKRLKIYATFFALTLAGSMIALNQVLTNMTSVTELTVKNMVEYLLTTPAVLFSSIGVYYNVDKIQKSNSNQKVKKHLRLNPKNN